MLEVHVLEKSLVGFQVLVIDYRKAGTGLISIAMCTCIYLPVNSIQFVYLEIQLNAVLKADFKILWFSRSHIN
jgi:hypothetical protein